MADIISLGSLTSPSVHMNLNRICQKGRQSTFCVCRRSVLVASNYASQSILLCACTDESGLHEVTSAALSSLGGFWAHPYVATAGAPPTEPERSPPAVVKNIPPRGLRHPAAPQ